KPARRAAAASACRTPVSLRRELSLPCIRRTAFHSLWPWRTNQIVLATRSAPRRRPYPPRVPQGVLEQVRGDEEHDHEHRQRGEQPRAEEPPVAQRDEQDGRDHGEGGGEDAEQQTARLEMQE